ncbi:MAG: hypothetical protein ACE5E9_09710 [Nitrospinaceae bacterium]
MEDKIESLLVKIKQLENELRAEIQKKERQFYYKIIREKVRFERDIKRNHKLLVKKIRLYFHEAPWSTILTAPVIWSCLIPTVFMDLMITMYQALCFPVYGIPKVRRRDYIVLDRHYLSYLNGIEKLNCLYCGYFNGLVAYAQEVGARTEQYWCPIKHARKVKFLHNRYPKFFEYGDGEKYREKIEEVRRSFKDIE